MKERKIYLDIIRIIATMAVVLIHVVGDFVISTDVKSYSFAIHVLLDSLARFCVPVFFMISGVLFLNESKKINYKSLYKKNILRLLISLIVFSILYLCLDTFFNNNYTITFQGLKQSINSFASGNIYSHLWFLYTIIGLYILTPLIKILANNLTQKKDIYYFLIIMFIFVGVLPTLSKFHFFKYFKFLNNFNLGFIGSYIGYYILGYLLDKYKMSKKEYKTIKILGFLSVIFIYIATMFFSLRYQKVFLEFFEYQSFPVMLYSIFIFTIIKNKTNQKQIKDNTKNKILKFSSLTFGIYLIHKLFIYLFITYNHTFIYELLTIYPFTISILFTILILLLSTVYSIIISKIPILNKYFL
ncbi:MAG: acyltransferase family protein [Bacilli bacterium]|nr:acyltransferase family protein [Bacilli bacterium]